jgi:hypothetical protein
MGDEAPPLTMNQFSNQDRREICGGKGLARFHLAVGGDKRRHPEPAVEGAQHLPFVETAG